MRSDLLAFYKDELEFLQTMGREFSEKHPKIASRLVLGEREHPDPHVERLLQGLALLSARVHLKIEDDFPEITDALFNVVYPHYLRPVPSMTVVEIQLDPHQGKLTTGLRIPRGTMLNARSANGVACRFQTCYDTTLWPLEIAAADWRPADKIDNPVRGTGAVAVIRLELRCPAEIPFSKLSLNTLRLHVLGTGPEFLPAMYEILLNNCKQIVIRDPANPKKGAIRLPSSALRPAGFEDDEAILPYPRRSFNGYRLLQEYFALPQKFHFFELDGLDELTRAGFGERAEILLFISPFEREDRWQTLERNTRPEAFRLGCTPVVNLFPRTAEPILLRHTQYEYPIVPDARRVRSLDIFSVDEVVSVSAGSGEQVQYAPFFSFRHGDEVSRKQAFWYARRRESGAGESDIYLTLVDQSGRRVAPDVEAVTARLTCSNGDLPSRLPFGMDAGDFELEGGGPIRAVRALERATPFVKPQTGHAAFWRLISHLALNHLSLVAEGRGALCEILELYNFSDSPAHSRQIQAIRSVEALPQFARLISEHGISFARGHRVEMVLDEDGFSGSSPALFASVLERFLGMYTTLNSFSQLVVRTPQRKEVFRTWQPRAGKKILM